MNINEEILKVWCETWRHFVNCIWYEIFMKVPILMYKFDFDSIIQNFQLSMSLKVQNFLIEI